MQLLSKNIIPLLNGELIGEFPEFFPIDVITDSRKLFLSPNALFVALKGPNFNGDSYVKDVATKGVKYFLVSERNSVPSGVSAIVVSDTLIALQIIAREHRKQFSIPVVGITGSNGKTIVKDWLAELCNGTFTVYKSPKSYNSQLGVALSLLGIREYHTLAIIEAGISQKGEMRRLQEMILPTHGVFTHFGTAHASGFSSQDEKFKEKETLFKSCKKVVVQDNDLKKLMQKSSVDIVVGETINSSAFLFADTDQTSVINTKTAIAAAQMLGVDESKINENLFSLQPLNMRLEQIRGINNCELINDGYSLDMDSLEIALNFMARQGKNHAYTVVVSDFDHSLNPKKDYEKMALLFNEIGVKKVIGIGPQISKFNALFESFENDFCLSANEFLKKFEPNDFNQERILIKGARRFKLEELVAVLQEKQHSTFVEINLNKLSQNIDFFRNKLSENTRLMAMVKASSYGSGTHEIANLLEYKKLDYLCVAYPDEGVELRKAGVNIPIMVLNTDKNSIHTCFTFNLEPVVYSLPFLKEIVSTRKEAVLKIHLELDTGMKRLGLEEGSIGLANKIIQENENIHLISVFSHLATAAEKEYDIYTQEQISAFEKMSKEIDGSPLRHICNTAGIIRFPNAHYDMVRLGIGMYGVDPTGENSALECAMSLKTVVSQIREIKNGETVGYSKTFEANKDMKIGVLPIGYADGIKRSLSNGVGKVYINGTPCKIVGNVCMDMCMIDLSEVNCKEGQEVVLFENNEQLEELALNMGTISYEVFTSISSRVKRVFIEE